MSRLVALCKPLPLNAMQGISSQSRNALPGSGIGEFLRNALKMVYVTG
jgi:hypothetical protein